MSHSTHDIARIAHEINRAYCQAIGDYSQLPWDEAPQWQRDSAVKGVVFCANNPDAPPSANHDAWLAEKAEQGWTWGEVKDPEKKEHPCFCAYEFLPVTQQAKDHLFKAVVAQLS